MKYFLTTFFLLVLFSCNQRPFNLETVLTHTVEALQDSLPIRSLNFKVELPPPIFDQDSTYIGYDTLMLKKNNSMRKVTMDSLKSINPKILLPFNDSLKIIYRVNLSGNLVKDVMLYDSIFRGFNTKKHNQNKIKINHKNITLEDLELTTFEDLVEKYGSAPKVWYGIKDRFFGGILDIEGIILNKEKNYVLMTVYYVDVPIDGFDYIVSLIKENGKWKVKEFHNKRHYLEIQSR